MRRVFAVAVAVWSAAAGADVLNITSAKSVSIPGGGVQPLSFAAALENGYASAREPKVLDVTRPGTPSLAELKSAFEVSIGDGGSFDVRVLTDRLPEQGQYTLTTQVTGVTPDGGLKVGQFSVDIGVAPAAITVIPARVFISQDYLLGTASDVPALKLVETSRRSRVRTLISEESVNPTNGNERQSRGLVLETTGLDAGQVLSLPMQLADEVKIGTTKGALKLTSSDLAQPVTVEYEIVRRLQPEWIFIVVAVGVALSYFVRRVLAEAIQRQKRRATRDQVIAKLDAEIARHPDTSFQRALRKAIATLDNLDVTDTALFEKRLKDADDELAKQVADLASRLTSARNAAGELRAVVDTRGPLPRDVRKVLTDTADGLARSEKLIEEENATDAQLQLDGLLRDVNARLEHAADEFRKEVLLLLDRPWEVPFPPAERAAVTLKARQAADQLLTKTNATPRERVQLTLDAVKALDETGFQLLQKVIGAAHAIRKSVPGFSEQQRAAIDAAVTHLDALAARGDWSITLNAFEPVARLTAALLEALKERIIAADGTKQEALAALWKERRLVELAASPDLKPAGPKETLLSSRSAAGTEEATAPSRPASLQHANELRFGEVPRAPDRPAVVLAVANALDRLGEVLKPKWLEWVQTVFVGLIMAGSAYISFRTTFGYSFEDIFSVFAWAFGLDITTNEVVNAALRGAAANRDKALPTR